MQKLDLIVPVLNEAGNIFEFCRRTDAALKAAKIPYRIIFVVDESTDDTLKQVKEAAKKYSVLVHVKEGQPGKAFSILEGVAVSTSDYVVMIDGDLQYPPEAIPEMFAKREQYGVVVANRKAQTNSGLRTLASRFNAFLTGKLLLGLKVDTQSGLKLVNREIFEHLDTQHVGEWTIDGPILYTAIGLGFEIGSVSIDFSERTTGTSKINFLPAVAAIVFESLKLRLNTKDTYHLHPTDKASMTGSGVVYKKKRFITHSTLPKETSALATFVPWQKTMFIFLGLILIGCLVLNFTLTIISLIAILSTIYFIDVIFTLVLVLKSMHFPPEMTFEEAELDALDEKTLPVYSILCPLFKEASVVGQFLANIEKLDYPKSKLDVLLLLEEGDSETIEAAESLAKPKYLRIVIVPNSQPQTKPKASNYGLSLAVGEFVVVYDAEDQPDPLQLKKAVLGFRKAARNVACLQAKLNYYNPGTNLLTRLFTAEYSLWFDLVLPALQSIDTTIPLGGTSNHFRRLDLIKLHGWDAFNVTEDCDLGARLFKEGLKTAIIDSVTLEEANSNTGNWIRQRSRWIKGYFQTYLVHMRNPVQLVKNLGWHALIFQLVIGARTTFMLINPILWLATLAYFTLYSLVGPTIESFYPTPVFYMAVFSLAFGNFIYFYNYMIGCAKRGHWDLIKYVFFVPVYWLFVSLAAIKAFSQLLFKPHYWEKTNHGLHLAKTVNYSDSKSVQKDAAPVTHKAQAPIFKFLEGHKLLVTGGILIFANLLTNFLFLVGSTLVSRSNVTTFDQLGILGLIGSLLTIFDVFSASFGKTISYQTGFLFGKYDAIVKSIWKRTSVWSLVLGLGLGLVWVISVPFVGNFLHTPVWPLYIFAPVFLLALVNVTNSSFLLGGQKFVFVAFLLVIEAVAKTIISIAAILTGNSDLIYLAMPLSILVSVLAGIVIIGFFKDEGKAIKEVQHFPSNFFVSSVGIKISTVIFFGADVVLAKHLLTPTLAGQYALLTSIGKMVYIFGGLFTQFIVPLISKDEGGNKRSTGDFKTILMLTVLCSSVMAILVGPLGGFLIPLVFGSKSLSILGFLIPYAVAMAALAVAGTIVNYHQVRKHYLFTVMGLIFAILQAGVIYIIGTSLGGMVTAVTITAAAYLGSIIVLHLTYGVFVDSKNNLLDLFGLFKKLPEPATLPDLSKLSILVFNWRDTKHVWAGGAEVYIHELSKRWVAEGNRVTMFCGHDGKNPRSEVIDGVQILRRGGFVFVYVWALLYYLFKFKGKYDVIIDCENGIPFFTPLFVKEKVVLLIHHVHQEIFRHGLPLPFYYLATFLETQVMPFVYKNVQIITVSESSKAEIMHHKLTKTEPIVVHNGVDLSFFKPGKKSKTPLIVYVGRLKKHKSLQIFIKAAKRVLAELPSVEFVIAGDGPDKQPLFDLVKSSNLEGKVKFTGKVSEDEKLALYQKAWVFVNPSMMEGWGITSVEANACGTPVVASNVPGLRDSIDNPHTGFLVPYGDETRFAERITTLITNKQFRQKTGKYAVLWAKKFSWDKSSEDFLKVLNQ